MAGEGLERCSRDELAVLVREYLMAGHLIDRAGMPHVMAALGPEGFGPVAIEEWMGASPIYSRRMQKALRFEGDSVETIFKGMQFDIGAPPQFLDFRYELHDRDHGEFWLDHCGALADVEPMGEDLVFTMCHDIEDPTFDATAAATNPRAQVQPVHRPPRMPADRSPVCHWTVTIADEHEPVPFPVEAQQLATTLAAALELDAIDPGEPGISDYSGPLVADVRLEEWSHSALVRIAQEICLEGHLLSLSFAAALQRRVTGEVVVDFARRQFTGAAGVAADRIRAALGLGTELDDLARILELHPALLPHHYTGCSVELSDRLVIRLSRASPSVRDGGWMSLLAPDHLEPLDAIVRAVAPTLRCDVLDGDGDDDELCVEGVVDDVASPVASDVELTRISTGATFQFVDRGTPVEVRYSSR
jgi:hypothetical protein